MSWRGVEEDKKAERERAAKIEAIRLEETRQAEAELKDQFRARFLATPGSTPAGFEKAWPEMLRQYQIRQTVSGLSPKEELQAEMKAGRHRRSAGGSMAGVSAMEMRDIP